MLKRGTKTLLKQSWNKFIDRKGGANYDAERRNKYTATVKQSRKMLGAKQFRKYRIKTANSA